MTFCGNCIAGIPSSDPPRFIDGVRICLSCAADPIESYDSERGYSGGEGGIGMAFEKQLGAKHDEIVPVAVVKLDRQVIVTESGHTVPARDELSPLQQKYHQGRDSRNRTRRKDTL